MNIQAILIAVAVVAATGLIAAVLLAVASHFMAVKVDETVVKVRECLPGANCGACGFTGCDGYAEALASGKTDKSNLCVPGGDKAAKDISELLGLAFADVEEQVAFVHCNGNCDDSKNTAKYDGVQNCKSASLIYGGPEACVYGCLGFGDCSVACPEGAIDMSEGIARIDIKKCIGCGVCVRTCPKHIISLVPAVAKTANQCSSHEKGADTRKNCANGCIGCKKCELNCEAGAIKVVDNLATIDYTKCTYCGKCAEVCPVKCLKKTDFSFSKAASKAL